MRLRHRVKFNRPSESVDIYGNVKGEFVEMFAGWADVRETPGRERIRAGAVENLRTATITTHRPRGALSINEGDQIIARGAKWNVKGVANVGDSEKYIEILAEAGGAQ